MCECKRRRATTHTFTVFSPLEDKAEGLHQILLQKSIKSTVFKLWFSMSGWCSNSQICQVCSCMTILRSPAVNQLFSCRAEFWMHLCNLLQPLSAPLGMHARGSWPLQLGNAAQKSPALQHVCHSLLRGNDRRAREHRGTPLGCFNLTLMTQLPVSSKCLGSSSLVSLTPGFSRLFHNAANCLNLFWKFRADGWKGEADFQQ